MEKSIPVLFPTARTKSKKQTVDHLVSHLHHLAHFSLILALDCTRYVQTLKAGNLPHSCGFLLLKMYRFIVSKSVSSLLSFMIRYNSPVWLKWNSLNLNWLLESHEHVHVPSSLSRRVLKLWHTVFFKAPSWRNLE